MSKRKRPTAREVALRALRTLESTGGFSNRVLGDALEHALDLEARDRAFATTLFYGVLRNRTRLDRAIDDCAHAPRKLKGELREILRIAAFELFELDHPIHVAASQANTLTRGIDPSGRLRGLVTALLTRLDGEGRTNDLARRQGDPAVALEFGYSVPGFLAVRWLERLGPEQALARARSLALPPAIDLRVDLSRTTTDEAIGELAGERPAGTIERHDLHDGAIRLRGGGDVFHGPLHDRGLVSVQSLGSQRAAILLDPRPGERVLDACCGMGTKTLHLAERMDRRGTIVAVDHDRERLRRFSEVRERGELESAGFELTVVCGDLRDRELDLGAPFSAILLDAPCSGLGNLGRHPELRQRSTQGDLPRHAALQLELLRACLARLAPGGRLVYAVCSLEPEEGVDLVRAVVDNRVQVVHEEEITPETHASDGFYLCVLGLAE